MELESTSRIGNGKAAEMVEIREENPAQDKFVSRVLGLPVVGAAVQFTSGKFNAVRSRIPIVGSVVDTAYNTFIYASSISIVNAPIRVADSLACKTLDVVEYRLPVIKKTPDQIAEDTREMYSTLVEARIRNNRDYVRGQITSVKNYGEEQVQVFLKTTYGQHFTSSVENILNKVGWCIDNYVPVPKGVEYSTLPVAGVEPGHTVEKVLLISDKLQKIIILHTQAQIDQFARFSNAITNVKTRSIEEIRSVPEKVSLLYDTVKARTSQEGTMEHRIVATVKHAADSVQLAVRGAVNTLTTLPPGIQTALYNVIEYISTSRLANMPGAILDSVMESIDRFRETLRKEMVNGDVRRGQQAMKNGDVSTRKQTVENGNVSTGQQATEKGNVSTHQQAAENGDVKTHKNDLDDSAESQHRQDLEEDEVVVSNNLPKNKKNSKNNKKHL